MLTFSCSSCQKKLSVNDEHAGKKIKCPGCGQVSVAPSPEPPPPPSVASPFESAVQDHLTTADAKQPEVPHAKVLGPDPSLTDFLAPAQADDELGRLGKYRVLSILGRGGMGIVYKAEDTVLKRLVALKAILPSLGASAPVRKRFLREAQSLAAVEHDHIVRLYEVNEDRGVSYLAMEFLMGEPLDRRLARERTVPLEEVLRIGREVAEGLRAAHARGLIHRDIKPANLWLEGPKGRVKILDFGLARAVEEESRLTQSGAILGTPAYMAPEQGRGEAVDFRCDLFSLGVVLYRLSTGTEPFKADDGFSTMMAIAYETPLSPQMQNFDVPADLSDLIMQLLEKDPALRGTAEAVVATLTRIEKGEPAPAPKPPLDPADNEADEWKEVTESKSTSKPKSGKFPWLILLVVIAVVFTCVAVPLGLAAIFLFR